MKPPSRKRVIAGILILLSAIPTDVFAAWIASGLGISQIPLDFGAFAVLGFALIILPFFFALMLPGIWYLLPLLAILTVPVLPLLIGEWLRFGVTVALAGVGLAAAFVLRKR